MNGSKIFRKLLLIKLAYDNVVCKSHQLQMKPTSMKYSRWAHRRPSKVILPESEIEEPFVIEKEIKAEDHGRTKDSKIKSDKFIKSRPISKNIINEISDEIETEADGIIQDGTKFIKLFNSDSTFSQLMLKVKSRKSREKHNLMMLEGVRLNQDAILAGLIPQQLFFTRKEDVEKLSMPPRVVKLYKIPYKQMQLWSTVETAPGLVGFYRIPGTDQIKANTNSLPLTVICDNVRDPGNVGSILRISAGAACKEVIFIKGCADIWDSKVLRAASGGHFRVPTQQDVDWDRVNDYLETDTTVLLADSKKDPITSDVTLVPYYGLNFSAYSSLAVVIGGETLGLSTQAYLYSKHRNPVRVHIPLSNDVDSLNTGSALSIILFEIKRQLEISEPDKMSLLQ